MRKDHLVALLCGAAMLALGQPVAGQAPPPGFSLPADRSAQPRLRWWWPGADVTAAELRREVREIADAGFGGVEIADVYDSLRAPIDPVQKGWATPAWRAALATTLQAAAEAGLTVDLTVGPHWPAALPSVTPMDDAAAKEMTFGAVMLPASGHFEGAVPQPALPPSGTTAANPAPQVRSWLLAVLAARCRDDCTGEGTVVLERATVTDLTARLRDGRLDWQAPGAGPWVLLAIYGRTTGQQVNLYDMNPQASPVTAPQSFVIDHFGRAGTDAVTGFWERELLTPEIRAGLRVAGGAIFEDSLELKALQAWTDDALAAFEADHGRDPRPELPALLYRSLRSFTGPGTRAYRFDDAAADARIRQDWAETMAGLWQRHHLAPLKAWAAAQGLGWRSQAYGGPVDPILAAALTSQPEGESLGFGAEAGKFQALRAGRDMAAVTDAQGGLLSDEFGAFFTGYATQWTTQMLPGLNRNFAYGVNQLYLHGYAYDTGPGAPWPGFAPFGTLFSEAWNGKQPSWQMIGGLSGYITRVQNMLQQGVNRTDIAVLRQEMDLDGGYLEAPALAAAGYTLGYLSPAVLALPSAEVRDGRLAAEGPGYRALIVPAGAVLSAPLEARLAALQAAGLPLIRLGEGSGPGQPVAQAAALPAALAALGIAPDMQPQAPGPLRAIHRQAGAVDYYYLFNDSDAPLATEVALAGAGVPWQLDPWTGQAAPLAVHDTQAGRVRLPLQLDPHAAALIALQPGPAPAHLLAAGAPAVLTAAGPVLKVTTAGPVRARLADGREVTRAVAPPPAPQRLTQWQLVIQAYRPGAGASDLRIETLGPFRLAALLPWTRIEGAQAAAGLGHYETTVTLDDWTADLGAWLELGLHADTVQLRVNGRDLGPVDQLAQRIDLGGALQAGPNRIEVTVATPLNNTLLALQPERFAPLPFGPRQALDTGLLGPVRLVPYRRVPLAE